MLLVVAYHAGLPLPGGFTGVDAFFVISGFVITQSLLRTVDERPRTALRRFYERRVRRLLPALAVLLAAVAVLAVLFAPLAAQASTSTTGIWASLFAGNVFLYRTGGEYFDVAATKNALLHTWTLGVEEQFYLFFPALLFIAYALARRGGAGDRRRRQVALVLAVVVIGSFVASLALSFTDVSGAVTTPEQLAFYSSPTRAWEFGVGALLALGGGALLGLSRRSCAILGAAGAAAVLTGAVVITEATPFPGVAALLPVLGTAALIVAGQHAVASSRLLSRNVPVAIGDLSYSWYLWHWPLIVFAAATFPTTPGTGVAAAALSLLAAVASYRWVENPIRYARRLRPPAVLGLAAVCVVVPIAASLASREASSRLRDVDSIAAWERSQAFHADRVRGCASPAPLDERDHSTCTWAVDSPRGTVVLVGDSNAGHFTEAVVTAANDGGYDALVVTNDGCPLVDLLVSDTAAGAEACRRFTTRTVSELATMAPSVIFVAARSDGYIENEGVGLRRRAGAPAADSAPAKAALWREGLAGVLRPLAAAGIPVVVVHPTPRMPASAVDCSAVAVLTDRCRTSVSRADVDRLQRRAVEAEAAAAADVEGVSTLSLVDALCPSGTCPSTVGGTILYEDDDHLSVQGALSLTRHFAAALAVNGTGTAREVGQTSGQG